MRKYLQKEEGILVVGLSLLLVSCGNPAAVQTSEPPTTARVSAPAMPAEPVTAAAAVSPVAAAEVPALSAMTLATGVAKLGVPVDLRYQFDGAVQEGQPVTLHLAAVPRVAGSNLKVTIKDMPGIDAKAAPIATQKASAATAYRAQLAVTRKPGGPAEIRVLVTMDLPEGAAFGWFSVPLGVAPPTAKQAPTKLE